MNHQDAHLELVYSRINSKIDQYIYQPPRYAHHREIMRQVLTRITFHLDPSISYVASNLDEDLSAFLIELLSKQNELGILSSQENLFSPPDTSFSINDSVFAWKLLSESGSAPRSLDVLTELMSRAAVGLAQGGVHTPNHRWEISSALAGLSEILKAPALMERVHQWLAESIDIYESGSYSERSANYAAYVSNPSLLAIASATGNTSFYDMVHRNLHHILSTTSPDGRVDTVYSRRQDQFGTIRIGIFAAQLVLIASHFECETCAAGAIQALNDPDCDDFLLALNQNLNPQWANNLQHVAKKSLIPARTTDFQTGRAVIPSPNNSQLWIYTSKDIKATDAIQSGLNVNPTILQVINSFGVLFSLRLSREFFNIGPFRGSLLAEDDLRCTLGESVSANFYQPLAAEQLTSDGHYILTNDGRFSAEMSFDARERDTVWLNTEIEVSVTDTGFQVSIETDGSTAWHCIELHFPQDIDSTSFSPHDDHQFIFNGSGVVRTAHTTITVEANLDDDDEYLPFYNPGETFSVTRGSDALHGDRLYATWKSPSKKTFKFHY